MRDTTKLSEKSNALALEYQAEYGSARGNFDISNVVNNPNASGICRVFGPGFFEEATDLPSLSVVSLNGPLPHTFGVFEGNFDDFPFFINAFFNGPPILNLQK